jgi:hypothetical protein
MDFCVVFCGAVVGELDILTPEMALNFNPELWCTKFYFFFWQMQYFTKFWSLPAAFFYIFPLYFKIRFPLINQR